LSNGRMYLHRFEQIRYRDFLWLSRNPANIAVRTNTRHPSAVTVVITAPPSRVECITVRFME